MDHTSQSPDADWHALATGEVLARLDSRATGLTTDEVRARLARYGPNRLPEAASRSALARLLAQFHNVLIYVLL